MQAIILAAGYATRMGALCADRPKPLLPVVGEEPIVTRIIRQLFALPDVSAAHVVTNDRFAPHFEAWRESLAERERVSVLNDGTRSNDDRLGAIGDLRLALEARGINEDFIVIAGDNFLDFEMEPVARRFRETSETVIVLTKPENREELKGYAVARFGDDGLVTHLVEKPDPLPPDAEWGAIALYFYPRRARELLIRFHDENPRADQPGRFPQWLVGREPVYAVKAPGAFYDIGTPEAYYSAREVFNRTAEVSP